ncbi:MAG: antibiotic biosynthesis monooxygenase [Candidatus Aminicenantes bacterium]|nr:antibiotic biosynthesis monooxygenase [Candidatus Aminicenantes bacterium]
MYARVTVINVKPDKVDEAIALYANSVVPAAKSQQGFIGLYLLSDKPTGKGMAITMWESEMDALANERSRYYQEQLVKFIEFFQSPPIREGYEISVRA